eukprot:71357_1
MIFVYSLPRIIECLFEGLIRTSLLLRMNQVPKPEHKAPAAPSTAIRGYVDGSLNHAFRRLYVLSAVTNVVEVPLPIRRDCTEMADLAAVLIVFWIIMNVI